MHRRSVLGLTGSIFAVSVAGCTSVHEDWQAIQEWIEDTTSLVESVSETLEEWAEDPESVPMSEFEELAEETTEHLERFESEVEPLREEIEAEEIEPEAEGIDGEWLWEVLRNLSFMVEESETATEGIHSVGGDPDELSVRAEEAVETVLEDHDDVLEDGERLLEE